MRSCYIFMIESTRTQSEEPACRQTGLHKVFFITSLCSPVCRQAGLCTSYLYGLTHYFLLKAYYNYTYLTFANSSASPSICLGDSVVSPF